VQQAIDAVQEAAQLEVTVPPGLRKQIRDRIEDTDLASEDLLAQIILEMEATDGPDHGNAHQRRYHDA